MMELKSTIMNQAECGKKNKYVQLHELYEECEMKASVHHWFGLVVFVDKL